MDALYSVLKITSMLGTGAFGALALLTKYKDDAGKMTKWGKVALGGIVISSSISLGLYLLEVSKSKAAADKAKLEAEATTKTLTEIQYNAQVTAEQQKKSLAETNILKSGLAEALHQQKLNLERSNYIAQGMETTVAAQRSVLSGNEKILTGVSNTVSKQGEVLSLTANTLRDTQRLLHPVNSLQLRIHLTIPIKTPSIAEYMARIAGELDPMFKYLNGLGNWEEEGRRALGKKGLEAPMPTAIGIPFGVAVGPHPDERANEVLNVQWIELAFYRKPIDPTKFRPFDARTDEPNQADIRARLVSSETTRPLLLHYFGSKEDLQIRGDLETNPEEWMVSGDLLSIQDLAEGQLFISLGPMGRSISADGQMDWFPERNHFYFTNLYLRISKRMFQIGGNDLTEYRTSEGAPYWCYRFRNSQTAQR